MASPVGILKAVSAKGNQKGRQMHLDVVELRDFYATPLGRACTRSICASLTALWGRSSNERIVGLGYPVPYLDALSADAERTMAFMSAAQGAVPWPAGGPSATALVFDEELPLADASMDRAVLVHLLEHAENPTETLKEVWRVLAPNGKVFVIVPNRRGIWARFEHTPFGTGLPFSKTQLAAKLREAALAPTAWSDALHFPPGKASKRPRFQARLERLGRRFWPIFSGVIVVEATKQLYQGVPAVARTSRRVFAPVLVPQGSGRIAPRTSSGKTL